MRTRIRGRVLVMRVLMLSDGAVDIVSVLDGRATDESTLPAALPLMLPLVRVLSLIAPDIGIVLDGIVLDDGLDDGLIVPAALSGCMAPLGLMPGLVVPLGLMPGLVVPLGLMPGLVVLLGLIVPLGAVVLLPGIRAVSPGSVELGAGVVVGGCVLVGIVVGLVVGLVPGLVVGVLPGVVWAMATALPNVSASAVLTAKVRWIIGTSPWRGAPGRLASARIVTRSVSHLAQL